MVIKAKRAKSIRKVYRDSASGGWISGGMVDESFPVDEVHSALTVAGTSVDLARFGGFFGPRLGQFRCVEQSQVSTPSVADELGLIGELLEVIEQLRVRMGNLPPMTDAFLTQVCWRRRRVLFHEVAGGIDAQLKEVVTLLWLTEREIEPHGGQAGRTSLSNRDGLLRDVAAWLAENGGMRKEAAAGCAGAILRASRVSAPDDPRECVRIMRKVEQRGRIARR